MSTLVVKEIPSLGGNPWDPYPWETPIHGELSWGSPPGGHSTGILTPSYKIYPNLANRTLVDTMAYLSLL